VNQLVMIIKLTELICQYSRLLWLTEDTHLSGCFLRLQLTYLILYQCLCNTI